MSGTREGGLRTARTNYKVYGRDFYQRIGAKGGAAHNEGGFNDRELASRAGRLGGLKSRRTKLKPCRACLREYRSSEMDSFQFCQGCHHPERRANRLLHDLIAEKDGFVPRHLREAA